MNSTESLRPGIGETTTKRRLQLVASFSSRMSSHQKWHKPFYIRTTTILVYDQAKVRSILAVRQSIYTAAPKQTGSTAYLQLFPPNPIAAFVGERGYTDAVARRPSGTPTRQKTYVQTAQACSCENMYMTQFKRKWNYAVRLALVRHHLLTVSGPRCCESAGRLHHSGRTLIRLGRAASRSFLISVGVTRQDSRDRERRFCSGFRWWRPELDTRELDTFRDTSAVRPVAGQMMKLLDENKWRADKACDERTCIERTRTGDQLQGFVCEVAVLR